MTDAVVGLLHPGEMGATLGGLLRERGVGVLWASEGRGPSTARRAAQAGLEDAGTVEELARRCTVLISVCPPGAAVDVARSVGRFDGVYVDANAIAPETAREIASIVEAAGARFVDAGIVGPPPVDAGTTRLYLSGRASGHVVQLFAGSPLEPRLVSDEVGDASAVKIAYAAWTKGTSALLLASRAFARARGVEDVLLGEWHESQPDLPARSLRAAASSSRKGWRWIGEMEEIAAAFGAAGLPAGFHAAAAEVFARLERDEHAELDEETLERVLAALAGR